MNKKWFLKLVGALLAVFLVTGCNADDQDPPPEDDGLETPGEDFNENMDNDVTPEEDVVPGDDGNGNIIGDDNKDGDLDMGTDDNDELGNNDDETNPGGGTGGDNGGTGGAGGGK